MEKTARANWVVNRNLSSREWIVSLAMISARSVSGPDMLSGIRKNDVEFIIILIVKCYETCQKAKCRWSTSRTISSKMSDAESRRRYLLSTCTNLTELKAISVVLADSSFSNDKKMAAAPMSLNGLRIAIVAVIILFHWFWLLSLARYSSLL